MFKGREPSLHNETDAMWSKGVVLITQQARMGNLDCSGILEVTMDWPEGQNFVVSPEEDVTCAEEDTPCHKPPENEKQYAPCADAPCHNMVGANLRLKAAGWSPTRRVTETAEGEGESSQFAEVKAIRLALDIAERKKWPVLCLYTDSWTVCTLS